MENIDNNGGIVCNDLCIMEITLGNSYLNYGMILKLFRGRLLIMKPNKTGIKKAP
jgi:hypothetical protein